LQQSFDDREVAVRSSPSHGVVLVGRRIDAVVSQQSFDDREMAETSSRGDGQVAVGRRIDALVVQQSFDDCEVAVLSSALNGTVVVGGWIEHCVSEQIIDDINVAVLSGPHKGDLHIAVSVAMLLAGFEYEHLLQKRQSTMGSVITECVKAGHSQPQMSATVLCQWAIPRSSGFHPDDPVTASVQSHLRWLEHKHALQQDVCLIAAAGGAARWLAYRFAAVRQLRVEHVLLTRDTCDADLKQRRELRNGSLSLTDGPVVRAATTGALLVLEGLERAERNVLPVLNNLLENRACPLEHGAALVSAARFAELRRSHSAAELAALGIRACHADFRVVAILAPGAPLDPPLRSRFAARVLPPLPLDAQVAVTARALPHVVALPAWRSVLALERFCATQQDAASGGALLRVPPFSSTGVWFAARSLAALPEQSPRHLASLLWPLELLACDDAPHVWQALAPEFGKELEFGYRAVGVERTGASSVQIEFRSQRDGARVAVSARGGRDGHVSLAPAHGVVAVDELLARLSAMLADAAVGASLCVLAAEGCGKSVMCAWFARALGYAAHEMTFVDLFKDVSSRDLFLRRDTDDDSGDTVWVVQPLVRAMLAGHLVVLDGAHRPPPGVLAALTEVLLDGQLTLEDGTKLLNAGAFDALCGELSLRAEQMLARGWRRVHESFRVILCGNLASSHADERATSPSWITADLIAGARCHELPPLTPAFLRLVLQGAFGAALPTVVLDDLCAVADLQMRLLQTEQFKSSTLPLLSLRGALRVAASAARFGVRATDRLVVLERALRLAYAPPHAAATIRDALAAHVAGTATAGESAPQPSAPLKLTVEGGGSTLSLGGVGVPIAQGVANAARIPRTLFFEVPSQLALLRLIMMDYALGHNLLLIGAQGTGKNKLTDEFVRLVNRECNFVQLHRDTTLQSLTTAPTLDAGRLRMVDSPVVEAVVAGRVLVVDEADKAPREVVAALRALAADRALTLSDGRRVHAAPSFVVFFLANRVGFPFLGENVLAELGDVCAVHSVDNLDVDSEVAMLRSYAPHVPPAVLRLLCAFFADLRQLVARGELSYPYSLREIVAVARHLEVHGAEQGLAPALRNVFDFDAHNAALRRTLAEAAARHGVDLFGDEAAPAAVTVRLADRAVLDADVRAHRVTTGDWCELDAERLSIASRGVWTPDTDSQPPPLPESLRGLQHFDERLWQWRPRDGDGCGRLVAAVFDEHEQLHVLSARPLRLYSVATTTQRGRTLSLQQHVPWYTGDWAGAAGGGADERASFALAALGGARVAILIGWFGLLLVVDGNGLVNVFDAPPAGPPSAPSIGIAGPLSFIAIARANSTQFANVQDAALVASKTPVQMCARPVSALAGGVARHALLWRSGSSALALLALTHELPMSGAQVDVRRVVRSVHWIGDCDPAAPVDLALIACGDGALLVLRVPLRADAPPFAVLQVLGLSSTTLRAAARCAANGAVTLVFDDRPVARLSPSWPAARMSAGLVAWERDAEAAAAATRAIAVRFLHQSHQIVSVTMDDDVHGVGLVLVDVASDRARQLTLPSRRRAPSKSARCDPVVAEASSGDFAVICEAMDNAVVVFQGDVARLEQSLSTWRFIRGGAPATAPRGNSAAQGAGEADAKAAQGQGVGDGSGEGHGDGSGTGAPSESSGEGDDGAQKKRSVAAELGEEARLFALRALREKLAAIDLSEFDARAYEARLARVGSAVAQLRGVFEAAQAASRERQWQSRKTSGELDEQRLVDALTGERAVYRVRAEREPGLLQALPKVMIFCVDASASMERFNAHDGRLERTLDCLVMVMEALDGWEHKFAYEIVCHSGDQPAIDVGAPLCRAPRTRAERWRLIRRVATHAGNCASGDASVEALRRAVRRAASVAADERIVLLVSDANLARHGIGAGDLAEAMAVPHGAPSSAAGRETLAIARTASVRCRCVFVAQFGDAARVQAALPRGVVHLVERADELPAAIAASLASEAGDERARVAKL
jgi:MoxR-like ATPase